MAEKKPMSLNERHQRFLSSQNRSNRPSSSLPEEEKPKKVKLEGRRRLCKASSKEGRADSHVELDQHKYSDIADFSPPSRNDHNALGKSGVSGIVELDTPPEKIRDILDDLSSKLEFMSIEKKKDKRVEKVPDSALSKLMEHYHSPGSSLSSSPDAAEISPDISVEPRRQGVMDEVESDKFFDAVDHVKEVDEVHKIEKKDYGATKTEKKEHGIIKTEKKNCGILKSEKKDYGFMKSEKKNYSVKKIENSVSKDKYLVVSDDEDPYKFLSSSNQQSSSRVYLPKEHDTICIDTPKQLGGGEWVLEDGDSIILTGKQSNYTLPGKIAKMLYPHQRQGLRWLWSLHCKGTGGILGDDMGLGKTMQMCSFIAGLFHSRLIKRVLVVAPKTLLSHWIKELTVVGLSAKIREYYGSSTKARQYELQYIFQDSGILLTTYDIVRNNYKSLRGDSYFLDDGSEDCITWDYTILDEGHIIKNPSTQRAKSLLEIPCSHRIIISGTPIQNNLKELWALFSFCCPELLGDKQEFKLKYESAILRLNDKSATDREKRIGSSVAQNLRARIEPYFLRRLKSEVFLEDDATQTSKISKKHELIVWLKLTQCQRQLYEAFLNSELVLSSFDKSPLAAITILKKICDHPYLLTKRAAEEVLEGMETMVNQEELGILEKMAQQLANATDREHFQYLSDNVSCKIAFILPLLDNLILEGHHVLIFSQTRKMLNIVQEAIISKGYNFLRIDGTTKMSDREKIVKDFQEGKGAPIFLLTSAVGGLGLTLTKADRVIVVDPAWNPSTDNQSVDRAYRIGQMKDVIVYRLMTCGTIEEKIYKMQVFKGGLFKTATENKEQTKYFSQQDLRELFSLPKEGFDVSVTQRQLEEEHGQHNTMSDSLKEEIEFLESHDIGGVSHHSLLFSKTAPAPIPEENEALRRKEFTYVGGPSSVRNVERNVDGAEFAFNPKEVKTVSSKNTASVTPNKLTESEIRDRIERLSQMYGNKAMISRLPDKGEKLKRQIADLSMELEQISMAECSEVIDLDEISGKLQRVHV
ncbi:DNA helicase [Ranunculus cassubicifolius]